MPTTDFADGDHPSARVCWTSAIGFSERFSGLLGDPSFPCPDAFFVPTTPREDPAVWCLLGFRAPVLLATGCPPQASPRPALRSAPRGEPEHPAAVVLRCGR